MAKPRTTHEVFHYWAHQTLPSAQVASVSYDGPVLYSYREPIAILVNDGVVHTTRKWSITTSGHQSSARGATRHLRDIHARYINSNLEYMHELNRKYWSNELADLLERLQRHPRRKISLGDAIASAIARRTAYNEFFQLGWPDVDLGSVQQELEALEAARQAKIEAAVREAEVRRQRDIAAEQTDLMLWRAGEGTRRYFETMALRINGDEIETTKGASIPVEHAKKIWPLLCRMKREGKTYQRNGHTIHLGVYALDSFDAEGTLRAGCHTIPWDELQHVAALLQLAPYSDGLVDETRRAA